MTVLFEPAIETTSPRAFASRQHRTVMRNPNLRIPEPTLPEHALIRDSAPVPELSAGLKSRVMVDCGASIAHARKVWRMKVAAATTAFCCLGVLFCLAIPNGADESPNLATQPQPMRYSSGQSTLAVDTPAAPTEDTERVQTEELIEKLGNRNQELLDANILPKF